MRLWRLLPRDFKGEVWGGRGRSGRATFSWTMRWCPACEEEGEDAEAGRQWRCNPACGHVVCAECAAAMALCVPPLCVLCSSEAPGGWVPNHLVSS